MIDQQLMNYFKFDQDDLYANQNGRFTDKQMARIIQEDKSDRASSRLWGGILLFIGLIGLLSAIAAGITDNDWGFRVGFGLGFGVVWPLVWGDRLHACQGFICQTRLQTGHGAGACQHRPPGVIQQRTPHDQRIS